MNDVHPGNPTADITRSRLRGFDSGAREVDDAAVRVAGDIPAWLHGALLLNGPALWELPGGSRRHWFDGYAMQHRLRIDAAGGRYRSRFVGQDQSGKTGPERAFISNYQKVGLMRNGGLVLLGPRRDVTGYKDGILVGAADLDSEQVSDAIA